jgi:hypothetical protein
MREGTSLIIWMKLPYVAENAILLKKPRTAKMAQPIHPSGFDLNLPRTSAWSAFPIDGADITVDAVSDGTPS